MTTKDIQQAFVRVVQESKLRLVDIASLLADSMLNGTTIQSTITQIRRYGRVPSLFIVAELAPAFGMELKMELVARSPSGM